MQVSQAVDQYKETIPTTSASHFNTLATFGDWCREQDLPLDELMPGSIRSFFTYLTMQSVYQTRAALPTRLVHDYTLLLKGFLAWCAKEGSVSQELPDEIEVPEIDDVEVVEVLTRDQFRRLLSASQERKRDAAILYVLLTTGMSARELCDLTLDNILMAPGEITIRILGRGGHNTREIGLGERASAVLQRYITTYHHKAPKEGRPVFYSSEMTALTIDELTDILHSLRDRSGVEGIQCNPDTFRQTFALMNFKSNGEDIWALAYLLGLAGRYHLAENYLGAYLLYKRKGPQSYVDEFLTE